MWKVGLGESLGEWHERIGLNSGDSGQDGYFTTIGGKILDPKVVYQKRLRGGGYGGGGKGGTGGNRPVILGARVGGWGGGSVPGALARWGVRRGRKGGNRPVIPGEWTCTTCWAPRCWPAKTTCYQCGTPRDGGAGRKDAGAGGLGAQAGVGTAMGGTRLVGPTGRNQVHVPGGDPTYRVNQARNSGAGGRFFFGWGWCQGECDPRGRGWSWGWESGAVAGAPLPVGVVLTDRDKVLQAMDLMKGVLGEEVVAAVNNFVQGHLPPQTPCTCSSLPDGGGTIGTAGGACSEEGRVGKKGGGC